MLDDVLISALVKSLVSLLKLSYQLKESSYADKEDPYSLLSAGREGQYAAIW
jgi:hypothetical protein